MSEFISTRTGTAHDGDQNRLNALESKNLDTRITTLENADLANRITALENTITALQNTVNTNLNYTKTLTKYLNTERKSIITSGTLAAGSTGCLYTYIDVPSGYKTTGIATISLGHPGAGTGLEMTYSIPLNRTGMVETYISYYTPKAMNYNVTDYEINYQVIKAEVDLS